MRYKSYGDYWETVEGIVCFRAVSLHNPWYEWLIFLHEIVEYILIKRAGIKIEDIDHYDMEFEKNRKVDNHEDPGDSYQAPYHRQHQWAMSCERLMASMMRIRWSDYEKALREIYG